MGRPTKRTDAIVDAICRQIAGGETLSAICRKDSMPDRTTVYDWINADETLSQRFARARDLGFDAIADEALGIADDGSRDYQESDDGRLVADHDHIARARLRVETRLKLLAKWSPKKYGDKIEIAGDPNAPLRQELSAFQLVPLKATNDSSAN